MSSPLSSPELDDLDLITPLQGTQSAQGVWSFLGDNPDTAFRRLPIDNDATASGSGSKRRLSYIKRTPSLAAAAEKREIVPVTDATRKRESSFCLTGNNCPIQKLPVELLHAIFIACLPTDEFVPISPRLAPLVVSCVCKHWRRLALGLPALWTSLALECGASTVAGHCAYLASAKSGWLSRAGRRPLSLSLRSRVVWNKDLVGLEHDYAAFLTIEGFMHTCTTLDLGLSITAREFVLLMKHAFVLVEGRFASVAPAYVGPGRGAEGDVAAIEVEHLRVLELTTPSAPCAPLLSRLVLPALRTLRLTDGGPPLLAWAATTSLAARSASVTIPPLGANSLREFSYQYKSTHRAFNPSTGGVEAAQLAHELAMLVSHPAMQGLRRLALEGGELMLSAPALTALGAGVGNHPRVWLPKLKELVLGTCVAPDGVLSDVIKARIEGCHPADDSDNEDAQEGAGNAARALLTSLELTFGSSSSLSALGFGLGIGFGPGGFGVFPASELRYDRDRARLRALAEEGGFKLVLRGGWDRGDGDEGEEEGETY